MTEPIEPPEGEVEGPTEPIPGGQPSTPPQPSGPVHGTYLSRNAGRRASILEAAAQIVNQSQLEAVEVQVGDAIAEVNNMGVVVEDYGTAIDDLQLNRVVPWAVPTIAGLFQTINRRADPTFPLSALMSPVLSGTTDTVSNHSHPFATSTQQMSEGGNVKGRAYFAFLTPAITRVYTQLNFMVGEVSGPCPLDVAIYLVDPATKTMTRQVHKTDVPIPLGKSVAVVPFDTFVATQGSYLAIAWLQRGTGNTRPLLGVGDTERPLMNNVFPRKISAAHVSGSLTSLATSIDGETNVNFETFWFTPYAELSENVGVDYKAFTERWGHGAVAPRPWVPLTSTGIYSFATRVGAGVASTGIRVSMYDTPLSTEYVRVHTTIASVFSSQPTIPRRSTLIVRGSNDLRSGVGLTAVTNTGYELTEWAATDVGAEWSGRTVVAAIPVAPQEGDQIVVEYHDGLVDVWINGAHLIVAQPVGGPAGSAGRFVGIQVERTGNALTGFFPSPYFGPWSARDLPQSNGGGDDGD